MPAQCAGLPADIREKALFQDLVEHGIADRHGERIPAEGRAMGSGRHSRCRLACREAGAKGESAAEALGRGHDVGSDSRPAHGHRDGPCGPSRTGSRRESAEFRADRRASGRHGASRGKTGGCRPLPGPAPASRLRFPGRSRPRPHRGSSNGTESKPPGIGPNPSTSFGAPAAAMVASVRPWKEPSIVMIRHRSGRS